MAVYLTEIPVDLALPPMQHPMPHQFAMGDNNAYTITSLLYDSRTPDMELLDGTVSGELVRPDGETVALTGEKGEEVRVINADQGGMCNATPCSVTLPQACFAYPGRVTLTIKLTDGTTITQALSMSAVVVRTSTDVVVDPGDVVPDIGALQAAAAEALEAADDATDAAADARTAASSAVRYDTAQTMTVAQKAQARGNIGAQARIEPDGAVALDLSDSAAAYISGNVGQTISYKSATASKVYKRIAWVQAGCEYVLAATSGVLASTNARVCAITDASNIILQRFDFVLVENGTGEVTFTAAADGLLCVCVDTSTTTVAMHGGALYGTVRYNTQQSLTDAQQAQALVNVGAASQDAIAPSDTATATTQHTVGSLLTVGGTLYKATQAIVAGDTITPGTNVSPTTVAAQLAERDTAIAAETAARETAIAGLPMSAGAYFAGLLGGNGTVDVNRKQVTVSGNHIHMEGMGSGTSASTYAMFNTLGTTGGASGSYSAASVKSLFTAGKCYTGALLFATGTAAILRIAYNKQSSVENPAEWDWGFGLYTYDASTDTLTQGVHQYSSSPANGMSIREFDLSADFIAAAQANGKLALVIYGKSGAQWLSSKIDLYWEIIPAALTT